MKPSAPESTRSNDTDKDTHTSQQQTKVIQPATCIPAVADKPAMNSVGVDTRRDTPARRSHDSPKPGPAGKAVGGETPRRMDENAKKKPSTVVDSLMRAARKVIPLVRPKAHAGESRRGSETLEPGEPRCKPINLTIDKGNLQKGVGATSNQPPKMPLEKRGYPRKEPASARNDINSIMTKHADTTDAKGSHAQAQITGASGLTASTPIARNMQVNESWADEDDEVSKTIEVYLADLEREIEGEKDKDSDSDNNEEGDGIADTETPYVNVNNKEAGRNAMDREKRDLLETSAAKFGTRTYSKEPAAERTHGGPSGGAANYNNNMGRHDNYAAAATANPQLRQQPPGGARPKEQKQGESLPVKEGVSQNPSGNNFNGNSRATPARIVTRNGWFPPDQPRTDRKRKRTKTSPRTYPPNTCGSVKVS